MKKVFVLVFVAMFVMPLASQAEPVVYGRDVTAASTVTAGTAGTVVINARSVVIRDGSRRHYKKSVKKQVAPAPVVAPQGENPWWARGFWALVAIAVAGLIAFAISRIRNEDLMAELLRNPEKSANATVTAMRIVDSAPIVFEANGQQVTYQSPVECAQQGFYLLLELDSNNNERKTEKSPGVARRSCASSMRRYFSNQCKPEQKALIDMLHANHEISWRTAV